MPPTTKVSQAMEFLDMGPENVEPLALERAEQHHLGLPAVGAVFGVAMKTEDAQ